MALKFSGYLIHRWICAMTPKYFIQHDYKHDRCHVRGNRESLVTQRSFSGRKQLLGDCFFTVNKIKTNLLPLATKDLGPVVQRPISPNPGLNFNSGFFIPLSKSLLRKFSLFFLEHPMIKLQAKRFELNFLLKLSDRK